MVSDAPTLIHELSEWRKPAESPPTRKDANKNGCILAVHKLFDFDADWWHFQPWQAIQKIFTAGTLHLNLRRSY